MYLSVYVQKRERERRARGGDFFFFLSTEDSWRERAEGVEFGAAFSSSGRKSIRKIKIEK